MPGTLQSRGAANFIGYLKRPDAYCVDDDGWFEAQMAGRWQKSKAEQAEAKTSTASVAVSSTTGVPSETSDGRSSSLSCRTSVPLATWLNW